MSPQRLNSVLLFSIFSIIILSQGSLAARKTDPQLVSEEFHSFCSAFSQKPLDAPKTPSSGENETPCAKLVDPFSLEPKYCSEFEDQNGKLHEMNDIKRIEACAKMWSNPSAFLSRVSTLLNQCYSGLKNAAKPRVYLAQFLESIDEGCSASHIQYLTKSSKDETISSRDLQRLCLESRSDVEKYVRGASSLFDVCYSIARNFVASVYDKVLNDKSSSSSSSEPSNTTTTTDISQESNVETVQEDQKTIRPETDDEKVIPHVTTFLDMPR